MAFIEEIPLEEATVAARCSFSKVLDGVGAAPDAAFMNLDENLRRTLAVGRPFDGGAA